METPAPTGRFGRPARRVGVAPGTSLRAVCQATGAGSWASWTPTRRCRILRRDAATAGLRAEDRASTGPLFYHSSQAACLVGLAVHKSPFGQIMQSLAVRNAETLSTA